LAATQEAVKDARQRWKGALKGVGLPEDFAPPKVKQVVKSNEQVLELRRRRDTRKDELDQRERELLVVNNRLQQILDDVRHPCASDQPIVRIRELVQAVAKEKETLALRDGVEKSLRKLARSRDKLMAILRKASRARHALLTLAGVENEKGFRQAAADSARQAELKRQHAELTLRIQTALASTSFKEDQVAKVFEAEGRDIQQRWDQRQQQLGDIRKRLAQLHERRGACTHEMQSLAADKQRGQLALELASVEVQLADAMRRWKILAVIGRLLEAVRQRYETDRQPETLREASQYLVRLTDGNYTRVWMPLDRGGLLVENDKGESLSLDVLSRGTREAVFIGLRLALLGSFARRGATLPLVLDDVLVNFDTERVRCAAEVLCEFAKTGHQVIMFTCHEHITDIFEDAGGQVRLLPARDGKVRERRVRKAADIEPPALPAPSPEPEPVRSLPIDPNPLLQMAAAEEQMFDPVHPLPPKPKREKRKTPQPATAPLNLHLPDSWPLAPLPPAPKPPSPPLPVLDPPRVVMPMAMETFEVLAYRPPMPAEEAIAAPTAILSPPETLPRPPKHKAASRRLQRFTWESPEMYHDD
jgi:uncharacterized protein YhaN